MDDRKASLYGPWPTDVEVLAAEFGSGWDIWRDVREDGTHGDWHARRRSVPAAELTAPTTDELRTLLQDAA